VTDDPWKQQVETFGQYIKTQRTLAKLSLRQLAAASEVSDAYLSQLERGLHAPSIRVLKSLADAFGMSPELLLAQAGLLDDDDAAGPVDTESAIRADPRLTDAQKEALLAVYRGFVPNAAR
jgi:transcriptional regulator with XRE-family HTH domain